MLLLKVDLLAAALRERGEDKEPKVLVILPSL